MHTGKKCFGPKHIGNPYRDPFACVTRTNATTKQKQISNAIQNGHKSISNAICDHFKCDLWPFCIVHPMPDSFVFFFFCNRLLLLLAYRCMSSAIAMLVRFLFFSHYSQLSPSVRLGGVFACVCLWVCEIRCRTNVCGQRIRMHVVVSKTNDFCIYSNHPKMWSMLKVAADMRCKYQLHDEYQRNSIRRTGAILLEKCCSHTVYGVHLHL